MINELVQTVSRSARLTPEQAQDAVSSMLRFLAARLPSPLFGEIQVRLSPPPDDDAEMPLDRSYANRGN